MITGPQCRAARALAEIGRPKLAKRSGVALSTLQEFERKACSLEAEELEAVTRALESLGIVFIEEDDQGVGVRLKFTKSDAKQIARMEGEGGIIASDRVP